MTVRNACTHDASLHTKSANTHSTTNNSSLAMLTHSPSLYAMFNTPLNWQTPDAVCSS